MLIEKFRLQMVLQEIIKNLLTFNEIVLRISSIDDIKSTKNTHIHTLDLPVHHHQVNQGQVVHMIKVTVPQPTGQVAMVVDRVLDLVQSRVNHKDLKIKHFYLANLKFA